MKRIFIEGQNMIGRKRARWIAELVLRPVIGAGVEVATGAGLPAVAAGLHVPEQSFSQHDQCALILNVFGQVGGLRNGDLFERSRILIRPRERWWCARLGKTGVTGYHQENYKA